MGHRTKEVAVGGESGDVFFKTLLDSSGPYSPTPSEDEAGYEASHSPCQSGNTGRRPGWSPDGLPNSTQPLICGLHFLRADCTAKEVLFVSVPLGFIHLPEHITFSRLASDGEFVIHNTFRHIAT